MGLLDYMNQPAMGGVMGALGGGYKPPNRWSALGAVLQDVAMAGMGKRGTAVNEMRNREFLERKNEQERERMKRKETREEAEAQQDKNLQELIFRTLGVDPASMGATTTAAPVAGAPMQAPSSPMPPIPPGSDVQVQGGLRHEVRDGEQGVVDQNGMFIPLGNDVAPRMDGQSLTEPAADPLTLRDFGAAGGPTAPAPAGPAGAPQITNDALEKLSMIYLLKGSPRAAAALDQMRYRERKDTRDQARLEKDIRAEQRAITEHRKNQPPPMPQQQQQQPYAAGALNPELEEAVEKGTGFWSNTRRNIQAMLSPIGGGGMFRDASQGADRINLLNNKAREALSVGKQNSVFAQEKTLPLMPDPDKLMTDWEVQRDTIVGLGDWIVGEMNILQKELNRGDLSNKQRQSHKDTLSDLRRLQQEIFSPDNSGGPGPVIKGPGGAGGFRKIGNNWYPVP